MECIKESSYEQKNQYLEEYPQLENFFYVIPKIENEFENSKEVEKKLFQFGMKILVHKNNSDIVTSTNIAYEFFSQIVEEVPEFQDQTQCKMFKGILDKFDMPDKSKIEAYVRERMPHLN